MRLLQVIAVGLITCALAGAGNAAGAIWGEGSVSCGEYLQALRREENARRPNDPEGTFRDFTYFGYESWRDGFFSGMEIFDPRPMVVRTDPAGRVAWMANYCRSYPTETLASAALELWNFLHKPTKWQSSR